MSNHSQNRTTDDNSRQLLLLLERGPDSPSKSQSSINSTDKSSTSKLWEASMTKWIDSVRV